MLNKQLVLDVAERNIFSKFCLLIEKLYTLFTRMSNHLLSLNTFLDLLVLSLGVFQRNILKFLLVSQFIIKQNKVEQKNLFCIESV